MATAPPHHVADLLLRGAVTEKAKDGLAVLRALPAVEAWWLVVQVIARSVLPQTLEDVAAGFSQAELRRAAEPLNDIARRLRALPPLPASLSELTLLVREARPLTLSRFLGSFERSLTMPGDAWEAGPLRMTFARWPGRSSSGHWLDTGGEVAAATAVLEALAALRSAEPA